jgi:plastocyanin
MKKQIRFIGYFLAIGLIAVLTIAMAACSSTPATSTTTTSTSSTLTTSSSPTGQPVTIALTAQNMSFDKSVITVSTGAQITINFNNMDSGIPHNFAVYTNSSASTSIFIGTTITGPATTTYTFTAPNTPGTYFFRCDIHPTTMTGQFIVQ